MQRTFSIITTSMSRLDHLNVSLPEMLKQPCAEVIVVDFSCPQGTGEYIKEHFPSVRVVSVEGEHYFSNWKARNAGASVATSEIMLFCDADTILADNTVAWISDNLPENAFGFFERTEATPFNQTGLGLARNQMRGFHSIPSAAFRRIGGYDEVLQGYAAGGDLDLADRLNLIGVAPYSMDPNIIKSMIEHDDVDRTKHHLDPIATSYCAGLLYRSAKSALLRITNRLNLPLETRRSLYDTARTDARNLGSPHTTVRMTANVDVQPILMPRQLGYEKGTRKVSLRVEVSVENKLETMSQ